MKTNKPDQTDQPDQHGWAFDGQSVLDGKGRNVCKKVNGHLIAAAPDLLEACQELLEAYAPLASDTVSKFGEQALHSAVKRARAAIAKATGKAGAK